jgi:RimJ/RimL family protein N-acetyltransferase
VFRDDHVRRYLLDGALVDRAWVRAEIDASARRFADGGLGGEMARAMVDLAFERAGLEAVRAAVDEPNRASMRVLERLGMTVERRSPGAFGQMVHYVLHRGAAATPGARG